MSNKTRQSFLLDYLKYIKLLSVTIASYGKPYWSKCSEPVLFLQRKYSATTNLRETGCLLKLWLSQLRMFRTTELFQTILYRVYLPYLSGSFQYTGYNRKYWLLFRVLLGLVRKPGSPISNPLQHEFFIQVKELVHDLPHLHQQVNCSQDRYSTENPSVWSHNGEPNSSSSSKSQICQGASPQGVSRSLFKQAYLPSVQSGFLGLRRWPSH